MSTPQLEDALPWKRLRMEPSLGSVLMEMVNSQRQLGQALPFHPVPLVLVIGSSLSPVLPFLFLYLGGANAVVFAGISMVGRTQLHLWNPIITTLVTMKLQAQL